MAAQDRYHYLDAVRAFALLLGVAFHASMSFVPGMLPGLWPTVDTHPSVALGQLFFISHIFRMSLFFLIAGFFARMLYQRDGLRGFCANRGKRIAVPLIVGWVVLFPIYLGVQSWGMAQIFHGHLPAGPSVEQLPPGFFPFLHLWFLYALLLLYPCVLLLRGAVALVDRGGAVRAAVDRGMQGLLGTPAAVLAPALLGAPLAVTLYLRDHWVYWGGIPAQDVTWIPQMTVLAGFGTAMGVGWLLHRRTALFQSFQKRWLAHLAVAVAATVYCSTVVGTHFSVVPAPVDLGRALFAFSYAVALWSWIFAILGLAARYLQGESRVRRYIADASYYIYLAHLPLVAALDIVVRPWQIHWALKYGFVLAASFAILFATYQLLVRPTVIGEWLNGRRYRGGRTSASPPRVPAGGETVARLDGVTRRYGKTVALNHVDLVLRRGELLALLGPNGAGKTSAISLWLGLAQPDAGQATLLGGSPLDVDRRRGIGVMMQDVTLAQGLRVRELIAQTASYYPAPMSVGQALELTKTTALAGRYYDKLSGGQKRQVQFALAVCGRPTVLFLDEPTAGLDVAAREHLWAAIRTLRASGCSILLTTHYLEEAESLADRIVMLARGQVVASGTLDEVRSVVSRRVIRCNTTVPVPELNAWPGVLSAAEEGGHLTLVTTDAEGLLRRMLARDSRLSNLTVHQAGLAEAFVELTQEAA